MKHGIRITGLTVVDFKAGDNLPQKIPSSRGIMTINVDVRIIKDQKLLTVNISVQYFVESKEDLEVPPVFAGSAETLSEFSLSEWDKRVKRKGNVYKVEDDLKRELIRIAYDSTRGLLRERGKGHLMGKMVLPVFDFGGVS